MLVVCCEGREYFAADAAKLVSRHSKLHLLRVDLSAEKLLGPERDEIALLWMDREAEIMKQIDSLLGVIDRLSNGSSEHDDVVDVHRKPDAEAAEIPNSWGQKLCRRLWGWS